MSPAVVTLLQTRRIMKNKILIADATNHAFINTFIAASCQTKLNAHKIK